MWLLPWNPNSDFYSSYDIEEHRTGYNGKSIWTLYKAKKKGTSELLSIFRFDIKDPNSVHVERAKQSLKKIKTLRHPSILKYVDACENEKSICIVTESIEPLADYLEDAASNSTQTQREFSIAYGLLSVAKGLQFLNNDCQLNHNNINIHSIFVNKSGVWKIGGLEQICSVDESPPPVLFELNDKYTAPERNDPSKMRHPGQKYAVDSWGFGCLVWESFNKPLTPNSSVKTVGKMPKPLSVHYNKLVQSSPKHRVSPMDFINEYEIQLIKDINEKNKFFGQLESELKSFPIDICKNKILPDLIYAFEYGEAGSLILNPIFEIGKLLNEEEYQTKLVPCIIKLYACKDRATRSKLLQQLESYIGFINSNVINEQIFPQVVRGFLDSNSTIREQTVKSMIHLAPKLNTAKLNDELLKHFTHLLARDDEGGIRANTAVCLGKIAKLLSTSVHQTVLIPTFLRILRDPFPPARHAAIVGICANECLFEIKDCATKIMPALCPMCLDPDLNVSKLSFKALRLIMDKVEKQIEKAGSPAGASPSAAANNTTTQSTNATKLDPKSPAIKD